MWTWIWTLNCFCYKNQNKNNFRFRFRFAILTKQVNTVVLLWKKCRKFGSVLYSFSCKWSIKWSIPLPSNVLPLNVTAETAVHYRTILGVFFLSMFRFNKTETSYFTLTTRLPVNQKLRRTVLKKVNTDGKRTLKLCCDVKYYKKEFLPPSQLFKELKRKNTKKLHLSQFVNKQQL